MGTPEYVVPVLNSIQDQVDLVGVFTAPDRAKGRRGTLLASPVKEHALLKNIDVFQPTTLRDHAEQADFRRLSPDLVVVAGYGKIIPPAMLGLPKYGFVNLHPSLLPKYRGASPVVSALLDGATETGMTLIQLGEGLDDGPIIAQVEVRVEETEDAEILTGRLFEIGADLLVSSGVLRGDRIRQIPQDEAQATFTRKIRKEDGKANWELTAENLARRARAFTPWPSLFSSWEGKIIKLVKVHAIQRENSGKVGTVIDWDEAEFPVGIVTGKGVLVVEKLQLEGKLSMSPREFVRGHKDFLGSVLQG